ncbi:hypothetical protein BDZ97DRAFT_888169 [Flammula alnicola]|nr:hypothetical protein BDZ97DRAFT_888169 [Flammula alnicola]
MVTGNPHQRDEREAQTDAQPAAAAQPSCPGYVVEDYIFDDGTRYHAAYACSHNNVHCQRLRRQFGVAETTDGNQTSQGSDLWSDAESTLSSSRDGTSSRPPPRDWRDDDNLRVEDEGGHPPRYNNGPPPPPPPTRRRSSPNRRRGSSNTRVGVNIQNSFNNHRVNVSVSDHMDVSSNSTRGHPRANGVHHASYVDIRQGACQDGGWR